MTSKERLMLAINREKPDRMPASVHQWQPYHLYKYMGGKSDMEAFLTVGLDAQIQHFQEMDQFWVVGSEKALLKTKNWEDTKEIVDNDPDHRIAHHVIRTPEGNLTYKTEGDRKTTWITEYLIKREEDIDLIRKYMPVPKLDLEPIQRRYDEVGENGILRGFVWGDQAGCWQHAACLYNTSDLIMATYDKPDWVHELLRILLDKKLQFIESMKGAKFDLVETGGGAGSSTVISPKIFKEFCLPYDKRMHEALQDLGFMVTYHTCGGTLGIEEYIVETGADVSETLAPLSVGGNQEPWDFQKKVGNRLALIGGLDQFNVLTSGSANSIREKVFQLFDKVGQDGGYVCSASDHFFETPVSNLVAFAEAARECVYI
jgi:uroporphyrinogen-III decarboxylase